MPTLDVIVQSLRAAVSEINTGLTFVDSDELAEGMALSCESILAAATELETIANEGQGVMVEGETQPWLVWSYEHDAWWGPNHGGYFTNILAAGIYSETEAKEIERRANEFRPADRPFEKAIPLSDALVVNDRAGTVGRWLSNHEARMAEEPSDTPDEHRLDYLEAVIADAAGRRFALTDGERVLYIETFGAVDVRTILDAEMREAKMEPTNAN